MQGLATMGSKRKNNIDREPNGRAQREKLPAPVAVRRLRDAALADVRHAEWGTELGRLYLNNVITAAMYAAGKKWVETEARHRRAITAFPVRCSTGERVGHTQPPDPDSEEGQKQVQREADAAEKFFEADAKLIECGPGVRITVRRVCEDGEVLGGYSEVLSLRIGLLKLADHWGLTATNKSGTR